MAATFTVAVIGATFASNKSMLNLFNGSGSGRVLRVKRIWQLNNQTAGVTGVITTFELRRLSASSGGTAQTPVKHDTASASLPAQVTAATGPTVTETADAALRRYMWSNDEPAASSFTNDESECIVPLNVVWDSTGDADIEPIVLREGQGISVKHTGSTTVGVVDIFIEFTDAAS